MDDGYEQYCFADPLFFDIFECSDSSGPSFLAQLPPLPEGWDTQVMAGWRVLRPRDRQLPSQGWKIHVSAGLDNAADVLRVVYEYCTGLRISFKFLDDRAILLARSSKYAPRAASGKFITIYPSDEGELHRVLADLAAALDGEQGPYVLSDLRYGAGPLYVRYGGFVGQWVFDENGERLPAVRRPDGTLVPDQRRPTFQMPDWVQLPEFLAPHLAARRSSDTVEFPYRVTGSLHFSNGGGVYTANRIDDDLPVVLKEARPLAGLDADGIDAVARLHREWDALRALSGVPGVPRAYELFTAWEHHFLAMQRMPGIPLGRWLARHYPLTRRGYTAADLARYTRRALRLVDQVHTLIAAVHDRGLVFGDLHPRNLLIDEQDQISLVDFEQASPIGDNARSALGAPGFAAPSERTGRASDEYALAALRLWLFFPLNVVLTLGPGKLSHYVEIIAGRFPVPAGYAEKILRDMRPRHLAPAAVTALDQPQPDWSTVRHSIARAIQLSATPQRTDRLFPGDIETFDSGGASFGCGAAGILHALHVTGFGRVPQLEDWLVDSVRRDPPRRPGFYDGAHGIAHVLDDFGHRELADALLTQVAPLIGTITDHGLRSGLAGIGLNLLHRGRLQNEPAHSALATDIGHRLIHALSAAPPPGPRARAGLLHGWSGPALLFVRLYEHTGDRRWLSHADNALRRDLAECVRTADGALQVRDGLRTLPYLAVGSAGIVVVALELLRHQPQARCAAAMPGLLRALLGEFVIQPGLMYGRAGLIAALAAVQHWRPTANTEQIVRRHLHRLSWHAIVFREHIAFPGNQLRRLSMDVTTGSAGVLLAISTAADGHRPVLPFLTKQAHPADALVGF